MAVCQQQHLTLARLSRENATVKFVLAKVRPSAAALCGRQSGCIKQLEPHENTVNMGPRGRSTLIIYYLLRFSLELGRNLRHTSLAQTVTSELPHP